MHGHKVAIWACLHPVCLRRAFRSTQFYRALGNDGMRRVRRFSEAPLGPGRRGASAQGACGRAARWLRAIASSHICAWGRR
jgi:hypothetical protein